MSIAPAETGRLVAEAHRLRSCGRHDLAVAYYRRALVIDPGRIEIHRDLLMAMLASADAGPAERFAEQRRFVRTFAPSASCSASIAQDGGKRVLNIGYVSANFARHPVGRAVLPLFEHHDRDRFRLFCYADMVAADDMTAQFRQHADQWRDITGLDDAEAAQVIRADGIDILVLLAGHLDANRPLLACHGAAPIQISYHDAASSGIAGMDYLLADPVLVPRHGPEGFSERVVRLPFLPCVAPPPDAPPPALPKGGPPVFGCFDSPSKLSPQCLELWAEVLRHVPQARLLLRWFDAYNAQETRRDLTDFFHQRGIAPERLDLRGDGGGPPLDILGEVHVVLDTMPVSGSTATFQALWMGVPVITLPGDAMMGRWSAAFLTAAGLDDLVATGRDDYVQRAAALVTDAPRLAQLRHGLRPMLAASPLCDFARRTRQLERCYTVFWRRWRNTGQSERELPR